VYCADVLHRPRKVRELLAQNHPTDTDALDRVIISRFDPPLMPRPTEQANNQPFPDVSDVLSIEDDAEFIRKMEQAIK